MNWQIFIDFYLSPKWVSLYYFSLITSFFVILFPLTTCPISNCEILYKIFMVIEILKKYIQTDSKKFCPFFLILLLIISFYNWVCELESLFDLNPTWTTSLIIFKHFQTELKKIYIYIVFFNQHIVWCTEITFYLYVLAF